MKVLSSKLSKWVSFLLKVGFIEALKFVSQIWTWRLLLQEQTGLVWSTSLTERDSPGKSNMFYMDHRKQTSEPNMVIAMRIFGWSVHMTSQVEDHFISIPLNGQPVPSHRQLVIHHRAVDLLSSQLGFSYFDFKLRLIRLGLSFQKQKILYSNPQPTES